MKRRPNIGAAVLVWVAAVLPCASAPRYELVDLGVLPGCGSTSALAVNNRGEVVGIAQPVSRSGQSSHAFYWNRNTGMVDLGQGVAYCINNRGQIAGYYLQAGYHACIWDSLSSRRDLGSPGACMSISQAE